MSNLVPVNSGSKEIVLKKPEKIAGAVVGTGVAVGAGYGLYKVLPALVSMSWGLLQIAMALALTGAVLYVVMDKQTRTLAARAYRLLIRGLWRTLMKYDPIGNLQEHISYMEKKLVSMDEQRAALHGQVVGLRREIDKNEQERVGALKRAQAAKSQPGAEEVLTLEANKAGRRERTNAKLTQLLGTVETCDRILTKMRRNAAFLIDDTKDEVDQITREFLATKAAGAAAENAMEIINGDPEMKRMYQDTMSYLESEVADRVGKFEMIINDSEGFIKSIDIQNAVYKQSALETLEAWEKKSDQLLLNPDKPRAALPPGSVEAETVADKRGVYALFSNKGQKQL